MPPTTERLAGLTVPLFSLRTDRSMGIGEITDLADAGDLARAAGLRLIQLLPVGELSGAETSPYGAISAFGIDPIYLGWAAEPDLPSGLRDALGPELAALRVSAGVDYERVRGLKRRLLDAAWGVFAAEHLARNTARAKSYAAFVREHAEWLHDLALFRALKDAHGGAPWWQWPATLRDRDATQLEHAAARLRDEVQRFQYAQWLAHSQWSAARAALRAKGVALMGDLPFMVGRDSADVWAKREEFGHDASVGVPGDQFNEEGQEWGLPPYNWAVMRANGFRWLRARARYAALLVDRFRVDHLVGFYRTYSRPHGRLRSAQGRLLPGSFDPPTEPEQLAHGEAVLRAMIEGAAEHGARVVAEDLGVVPDFVRPSLQRLGIPGYKVLRWEQDHGQFRDPRGYPAVSVACLGTHDTDPVASWWGSMPAWEREAAARAFGLPSSDPRWTPEVHAALLSALLGAASGLVLLMWQDVVGTLDRINTPSTVGAHNWTWRLPATIANTLSDGALRPALDRARAAAERAGR
jgi:4-alpha-glucanotransferase